MTRKLECIKINELGMTELAHNHLCRYAVQPPTKTVCNDDKPCDRKYIATLDCVPMRSRERALCLLMNLMPHISNIF